MPANGGWDLTRLLKGSIFIFSYNNASTHSVYKDASNVPSAPFWTFEKRITTPFVRLIFHNISFRRKEPVMPSVLNLILFLRGTGYSTHLVYREHFIISRATPAYCAPFGPPYILYRRIFSNFSTFKRPIYQSVIYWINALPDDEPIRPETCRS